MTIDIEFVGVPAQGKPGRFVGQIRMDQRAIFVTEINYGDEAMAADGARAVVRQAFRAAFAAVPELHLNGLAHQPGDTQSMVLARIVAKTRILPGLYSATWDQTIAHNVGMVTFRRYDLSDLLVVEADFQGNEVTFIQRLGPQPGALVRRRPALEAIDTLFEWAGQAITEEPT
jgi:hypothetical protein